MMTYSITLLQHDIPIDYREDRLERVLNDYGYMDADDGFHYHIKDWQACVRAVIDEAGTLEEVNSYYPYGALMGGGAIGGGSVQPYKYGGKELDRQAGLDWYDSQARMYDPLLGRTPTMDPKAEDYYAISPYAWCAANPMRFIDPDGQKYSISGSSYAIALFLDMLHEHSGDNYSIDNGYLVNNGPDNDFRGIASNSFKEIINAGIESENIYAVNLVEQDDEETFIDSYVNRRVDLADLTKLGEESCELQAASIAHIMKEYQFDEYDIGHKEASRAELDVYSELTGDTNLSNRKLETIGFGDGVVKHLYQFSESHQFEILTTGFYKQTVIGQLPNGTPINSGTYVVKGKIISVKKCKSKK